MRFHLADVFLPSTAELPAVLREVVELEGTVIGFSDSGNRHNAFAIIEIIQRQTAVVPIEKLKPAHGIGTTQGEGLLKSERDGIQ